MELEQRFLRKMHAYHRSFVKHRKRMECLPPHHFFVLLTICHLQNEVDTIYPSTISQKTKLTRAAITQSLNFLEKNMYIKRDLDQNDRRKFRIYLTDEGKKILERAHGDQMDRSSYIVKKLGKEKTELVISLCDEIININEEYNEEVK